MKTSEKIIAYIQKHKQVSAATLVDVLEISERAVFKQLKKLTEDRTLSKIGKPPQVYYFKEKYSREPKGLSIGVVNTLSRSERQQVNM